MARQELGSAVWYDDEGSGYVMLDVTDSIPLQSERSIDGQLLMPKDEYHCTLVPVRKIIENSVQEKQLVEVIRASLAKQSVRFSGLGDERYVCKKEDEMTVIAPVSIDGIDTLNRAVQQIAPAFTGVFAHVTLLKNESSAFGIGVTSLESLAARCEKRQL
jgi:hypothetical protein